MCYDNAQIKKTGKCPFMPRHIYYNAPSGHRADVSKTYCMLGYLQDCGKAAEEYPHTEVRDGAMAQ